MQRRETKPVKIGAVPVGGDAPLAVQSMLSVPSADIEGNLRQAQRLQEAGCAILRVSVPTMGDIELVKALKKTLRIPLVADIHFDYKIALAAVEAGIDKIRINPGNIGGKDRVRLVARACKDAKVPIRIGVNGGSLEKELLEKYGRPTAPALVESALNQARLLEENDFTDIVISLKSSHVPTNVAAYRLLAQQCAYPLHLGVTEAGTYRTGLIKNAMGIGSLLLDGIGDTLRVSLTDEPEKEVQAGYDILRAAGFALPGPEIISCPTCGRTCVPVAQLAEELAEKLKNSKKTLKIAVMGCVVNGIGEGKEADLGLAGGKDSAVLFKKGEKIRTIRGNYLEELLKEIENMGEI